MHYRVNEWLISDQGRFHPFAYSGKSQSFCGENKLYILVQFFNLNACPDEMVSELLSQLLHFHTCKQSLVWSRYTFNI